jgi:hypothetical protein
VVLDPNGQNYNAFASVVRFVSGDAAINHVGIDSSFVAELSSGFVV